MENIVEIARKLSAKKNINKIYISTLLPRVDEYNVCNQQVNELLLKQSSICTECVFIDAGGRFYGLNQWQSYLFDDGLHPNLEGYMELAKIFSGYINNADLA